MGAARHLAVATRSLQFQLGGRTVLDDKPCPVLAVATVEQARRYVSKAPRREAMSARTNRWAIAAAIAALILGTILSHVIDPGVRVEKIMLTTNTPALRLFPATPGPHPIALLAHGGTGS